MRTYWEIDLDDAMRSIRTETLIRDNGYGNYTILGVAKTQKQYDLLNKKYKEEIE